MKESLSALNTSLPKAKSEYSIWCSKLKSKENFRYTVVDSEGKVLCDTIATSKNMSNHIDRPEILDANLNGYGFSQRYSDTLKSRMFYATKWVPAKRVYLRQAIPIDNLFETLHMLDRATFTILLPVMLVFSLIALFISYRMASPLQKLSNKLNEIQDEFPGEVDPELFYKEDEWQKVYSTISKFKDSLEEKISKLEFENNKVTTLMESLDAPIIAIDLYGNTLLANSKFKEVFNSTGTESALHSMGEDIYENFKKCISSNSILSFDGLAIASKENEEGFFSLSVSPIQSSEGNVLGAIGIFYDVTRQKLVEKLRADFVSNISHELRTPLTSIKGYSQLLRSQLGETSEDVSKSIDKIHNNSQKLLKMFEDLLELSQIESTRELVLENVPVEKMVKGILDDVSSAYPERKCSFEVNLESEFIKADKDLIHNVIVNLVDNAFKYSSAEKCMCLCIRNEVRDGKVHLFFRDNGIGVLPDQLPRVFERFYRGDESHSSNIKGSGIGLAIVKHIIKRHFGEILVTSEVGKFTEFEIILPA